MNNMLDCAAAERRIRPHVIETPVVRSDWLSALSGAQVFLKLENLQETGAFKPRGATHKLLSLTPAQAARGVVAASSGGNHALAVARTAAHARHRGGSLRTVGDRPGAAREDRAARSEGDARGWRCAAGRADGAP
jgi:threonine dehydratase